MSPQVDPVEAALRAREERFESGRERMWEARGSGHPGANIPKCYQHPERPRREGKNAHTFMRLQAETLAYLKP